jgi:hypothetical protein
MATTQTAVQLVEPGFPPKLEIVSNKPVPTPGEGEVRQQ